MTTYKLMYQSDNVIKDGVVTIAPNGNGWQEYQRWLDAGNTPEPADEPTPEELARQEEIKQAPPTAKQWLAANPQAKQVFSLSVADLETTVSNLINASFPLLTAAQRTTWKLLLLALLLVLRIAIKREALD